MNEITINYFFVAIVAICVLSLLLIAYCRKSLFAKSKLLWISIVVFLFLYMLSVGQAICRDVYLQWDLNRYDIDKDGFFSDEEQTKDMQKAMGRLINDLGRNLSFITGFIFSGIVAFLVYMIGRIFSALSKGAK